jgi:hypothetical protein
VTACVACGVEAVLPLVAYTEHGEETFCVDCRFPVPPDEEFDHTGLEGYDPKVVELADRLLALSQEILIEVETRRAWSATREEWVAVEQLLNAGNAVYSAQCWVLRAEGARLSRRGGPAS